MSCIKEFKDRIKSENISGTYSWLQSKNWPEKDEVKAYIEKHINFDTLTRRQKTIVAFCSLNFMYILEMQEVNIKLSELDKEEIQELILFYNLENPSQLYKEIKKDIHGPQSFMTGIPYAVVQELYKRNKIPFDREIFTACMVRFNVWHGTQCKKLSKEASEKLISFFPTDAFSLDILMGVFEMELGVSTAFYITNDYNIGGLIIALVNLGILERDTVHQKIFEAFNNPNLKQTTHSWVRNLHKDLAFTLDEMLMHQNVFINLLKNERNLLAIYGLQIIKKLCLQKQFNWSLFFANLDGIVYREKFNSGFNTVISILQKQLKKDPNCAEKTGVILAPIFLQVDHKIQLNAKKLYEIIPPSDAIIEALAPYTDTMHAEVKNTLTDFIPNDAIDEEEEIEIYQQQKYTHPILKNEDILAFVKDEDEFLFLCSKVLKSNNPIDFELFLDAFPNYYYLKENKALKPVLKQAKRLLPDSGYAHITNKVGAHHIMLAKLIRIWLDPSTKSFKEEIVHWKKQLNQKYTYLATEWLTFFKMISRVLYVETHYSQKLPLLSTPTHNTGEIHPNTLFNRLDVYASANVTPNEDDFNQALANVNRWTPFTTKTTNANSEYHQILNYVLSAEKTLVPNQIKKLENCWLTAYSLKNPEKTVDAALAFQNGQSWWNTDKSWSWESSRRYSKHYSWATTKFKFESGNDLNKASYYGLDFYYEYDRGADISHWFNRNGLSTESLYLSMAKQSFGYLDMEAERVKAVFAVVNYAIQNLRPIYEAGYVFLSLSLFCKDRSVRSAALDWLCQLIETELLDLNLFKSIVKKIIANPHNPVPVARVSEQFYELITLKGIYKNVALQLLTTIITDIDVKKLPKGFSKILNHFNEANQNAKLIFSDTLKVQLEKMTKVNAVKKEAIKIVKNATL